MFLTCPHRHSHRLSQCPGPCVCVCVGEKGRVRHWNPALVFNQHGRMMCDPLTSQDFCCCLTSPSKPLTASDIKWNKVPGYYAEKIQTAKRNVFYMHIRHKHTQTACSKLAHRYAQSVRVLFGGAYRCVWWFCLERPLSVDLFHCSTNKAD